MTSTNVRPTTLQGHQRMFNIIYREHNEQLYNSTHDILNQIWETNGKIAECVRKEAFQEVAVHIPILFGWLMALWNHREIGMDIAENVWFKYPNVCPYCFRQEKCLCITEELKYRSENPNLNSFRRDRKAQPQSLAAWQEMFSRIYGNINKIKTKQAIWLHFFEELAEVSRELRHGNVEKVREESADVFAWLMAFCTKLGIDIDEVTWRTYPGECNVCHEEKCTCPYD